MILVEKKVGLVQKQPRLADVVFVANHHELHVRESRPLARVYGSVRIVVQGRGAAAQSRPKLVHIGYSSGAIDHLDQSQSQTQLTKSGVKLQFAQYGSKHQSYFKFEQIISHAGDFEKPSQSHSTMH